MKLRLTAAFMVVTALVGPLAMAADTEATPHAIVESQKDSASILPAQYKSYATKMNTVVKDYKNLFRRSFLLNDTVRHENNAIRYFAGKIHFMSDDDHGHVFFG